MENSRLQRRDDRAFYLSPMDVVSDPLMSTEEKRALLASWASDARAVRDAPALRELDNGAILYIDDILDALKRLDGESTVGNNWRRVFQIGRVNGRKRKWGFNRPDDDDNPPPLPAAARPPKPLPTIDAAHAIAA